VVQENLSTLKHSLIEHNIDTVWLAFGDLGEYRPYLKTCLSEMIISLKDLDVHWKVILESTQKGHPRHPLYKVTESAFVDFDIRQYVLKILTVKL
tara:strand:+ start:278 stop:562 length:285 start_codon:yes stop_codon:yes gene_type:complete